MSKNLKKNESAVSETIHGAFGKKDAVVFLAQGNRHFHSAPTGTVDPYFRVTQEAIRAGTIPVYSWEKRKTATELTLNASLNRQSIIQTVVSQPGLASKRFLREKISSVLEELVTNAIYHAYRLPDGQEKYARREAVTLGQNESVSVRYEVGANGLYLSVSDQAGSLKFEEVAQHLHRCYTAQAQIDDKEGGAGLGTYMIFDAATHLKFEVTRGKNTTVSCWISDQRSYDPDFFSINFFERRSTQ